MRKQPMADRQHGSTKIVVLGLLLLVGLLAGWHLRLVSAVNDRVKSLQDTSRHVGGQLDISVNALTNLVSITIVTSSGEKEDDGLAAFGSVLGQAVIQTLGPSVVERELNTRAREQYDFYAMLIPYRVRISTKAASK
jgi:hypothetical protein